MKFDATKAAQSRVVLLCGTDQAARRSATRAILDAVGLADDDALDLESLVAGERPLGDWTAAVGTVPFLADRRAVIVRNLTRIKPDDPAGAAAQIKALPASALLVLLADDEAGDYDRQNTFVANLRAWTKVVEKAGGAVLVFDIPKGDPVKAIKDAAEAHGKAISRPAAQALAEMVGGRLDLARDEVAKLALFIGEEPEIRESDVRTVVTPELEYNIWKLIDHIADGQPTEALEQLRTMVGNTKDPTAEAFRSIFPQVHKHFRLLWQARACVEAGVPLQNPGFEIDRHLPTGKNITSEPEWKAGRLVRQARRLDYARLLEAFLALQDADMKIKGQRPGFTAADTLEQMVLRLARPSL